MWLAGSDQVEGVTGMYYFDREQRSTSEQSYDQDLAAALWRESARLTELTELTELTD